MMNLAVETELKGGKRGYVNILRPPETGSGVMTESCRGLKLVKRGNKRERKAIQIHSFKSPSWGATDDPANDSQNSNSLECGGAVLWEEVRRPAWKIESALEYSAIPGCSVGGVHAEMGILYGDVCTAGKNSSPPRLPVCVQWPMRRVFGEQWWEWEEREKKNNLWNLLSWGEHNCEDGAEIGAGCMQGD